METNISIQIARKLVDRLPKEIADELRTIIARCEKEPYDLTTDILTVLAQHENSLLWFLEQMALQTGGKDVSRGFSQLAGDSSVPVSNKWICPKDTYETLPVMQEGEPAPRCDKHKIVMVRGKGQGG